MVKLVVYLISFLCVTFTATGINFNGIFKTNRIWEARFFIGILIICTSYILTSFTLDIISIINQGL